MAEILRLKGWRTFLHDGRSSTTYGTRNKKEVAVAVIIGYEPAAPTSSEECVPVDDEIVRLADYIRSERKKDSVKPKRKKPSA